MGQAKLRGSFEQRQAAAVEMAHLSKEHLASKANAVGKAMKGKK